MLSFKTFLHITIRLISLSLHTCRLHFRICLSIDPRSLLTLYGQIRLNMIYTHFWTYKPDYMSPSLHILYGLSGHCISWTTSARIEDQWTHSYSICLCCDLQWHHPTLIAHQQKYQLHFSNSWCLYPYRIPWKKLPKYQLVLLRKVLFQSFPQNLKIVVFCQYPSNLNQIEVMFWAHLHLNLLLFLLVTSIYWAWRLPSGLVLSSLYLYLWGFLKVQELLVVFLLPVSLGLSTSTMTSCFHILSGCLMEVKSSWIIVEYY